MLDILEVKALSESAILPTKAHKYDAGFDLYFSGVVIPNGSSVTYSTGIAVNIPKGYVGLIWPRSGLSLKTGYQTLAGVIDAGYQGEVVVVLDRLIQVQSGDRIAQLIIQPIACPDLVEVFEFTSDSARGASGFGSSGA